MASERPPGILIPSYVRSYQPDQSISHEGFIPTENAALYFREIGRGQPIIILHGGPDFDHHYLLPHLDNLAQSFRLIYYDQKGRGRSAENVRPEDVSLQSEAEDLERVSSYFGLVSVVLLGHSWGGVLAMEYAVRHPERVSHMILLDSAPASHADYLLLRSERSRKTPDVLEKLASIASTLSYQEGDLAPDAEYYRIHFRPTVRDPEQLERLIRNLRLGATKEGILKARAIEDRLMGETWWLEEYDLLPKLRQLRVPTLIIHGDDDLVPTECAHHITQAISGARLTVLAQTGHFSFIDSPEAVRREIVDFLGEG